MMEDDKMTPNPAIKIEREAGGGAIVRLSGPLDWTQAGSLRHEVDNALKITKPRQLVLDGQEVTGIDTAGVAAILSIENLCRRQGVEFAMRNLPESVGQYLSYVKKHSSGQPVAPPPPRVGAISRLGEWSLEFLQESAAFTQFLGKFLMAAPRRLLNPRRLHPTEIFYRVQLVGVGAVPLLVLLSLLLGALMVFQGMNSINKFGNPVFIADMVVIAVSREMAPLLTAVIMAGRTGAAFAAEIGTMKLNEEIEALTALNFDITSYVVLPRVFALMLAGPMLTMVSDVSGIFGGMVTARVFMQLPPESFLQEAQKILTSSDIFTGLIKGCVFGALIGLIGCFRGLRTGMGAGSVGIQTTSAVVTGIFVVIFMDTLFSYIFQMYGW
jgi:phospholipid/cholesterol/gamma-HCH transport system permease protein